MACAASLGAQCLGNFACAVGKIDESHVACRSFKGVCSAEGFIPVFCCHVIDEICIACVVSEHCDELSDALTGAQAPDNAGRNRPLRFDRAFLRLHLVLDWPWLSRFFWRYVMDVDGCMAIRQLERCIKPGGVSVILHNLADDPYQDRFFFL